MLNITHEEITKSFPILASRFCISARDDPKETANIILNHVENIYIQQGSWAELVRIDTLCLPWIGRPMFLHTSLKMLDDYFPQFWLANRSIRELPESNDIKVARVGDIVRGPILCDGKFVVVTGHQKRLQLYERHENGFLEFVFQLVSIDPEYAKSIIYVRYVLHESFMEPVPESQLIIDKLPTAPEGYLTTALGVVIACGGMTLADGSISNCAYVVAQDVYHMPMLTEEE